MLFFGLFNEFFQKEVFNNKKITPSALMEGAPLGTNADA